MKDDSTDEPDILVELEPPTWPTWSATPSLLPGGAAGLEAARINLVKVFSATKSRDRESLGDRVTAWLAANPNVEVLRTSVSQSSDAGFHCLSFVLFCAAATTT
jgi:hypothetical protein